MTDGKQGNEFVDDAVRRSQIYLHTCRANLDSKATDVNNASTIGPDFPTFPEAGIRFLRRLKRNNNRNWFQTHKTEYEVCVKKPMEELIGALALEFAKIAPEIEASPRVSLYRIYRDTRFSKDKHPYKTHAAAVFPTRGLGKHEGAGFYFHISPNEFLIGGGLYRPLPEHLRAIRNQIAENASGFEKIVDNSRFQKIFGKLTGDSLTRVPRGFPAEHRAATYLRMKQYLAARRLSPEAATSPGLRSILLETFIAGLPLLRFLNEPIRHQKRIRDRETSVLT